MLDAYLDTLGIDVTGRERGLDLLAELQLAHLMKVPFENLDVFHRRGVTTSPARSIAKIVERRRGGWCFELNGAFGWLLRELGYDATYASCRVRGDDGWGPDRDHCALIVQVSDQPWFVDVGFGDACIVPVPLWTGEHPGIPRPVRVRDADDGRVLAERAPDGTWADQLHIDLAPRDMQDFTPRSTFLQTEPGLMWTEKPFATRATGPDGSRVTLRHGVLRLRAGGGTPTDTPVEAAEWPALLREHFAIDDVADRA